jgi:L-fuconolactonase
MGKELRIDSHQHFWRYSQAEYGWIDDTMAVLRRDFLPEHLRPLLDQARIDGCIAVQAPQTPAETRFLLDLAEQHAWILGVVGWVDLRSRDIDAELHSLAAHPRLVGVRHIAQSEPDRFLVTPDFLRGIAALAAYDVSYDVLIYPRQLPAAIELVGHFPAQTFVLDHAAKPDLRSGELQVWRQQMKLLAQAKNVFCKLSGLATEASWQGWTLDTLRPAADVVLEHFGDQRVLFGSDWPVCQCATTYARWVETVETLLAGTPPAVAAAVFGGTARAAYPRLLRATS